MNFNKERIYSFIRSFVVMLVASSIALAFPVGLVLLLAWLLQHYFWWLMGTTLILLSLGTAWDISQ
jgi:hypothetical protein